MQYCKGGLFVYLYIYLQNILSQLRLIEGKLPLNYKTVVC